MTDPQFQEFWDDFCYRTAHDHRTAHLREYAAGHDLGAVERQVLIASGWLTDTGLTAAGRAWLTDQGLHLEVTDTALYRRLWPAEYCADKICGQKRQVPEPLYYAGRHWLCTGSIQGPDYHVAQGDAVLPPAEFAQQYPDEPIRGLTAPYWGPHGYCGCQVWHGQQAWVITERTLTVHLAPGDPAQPPPPPSQLALF